jgi:hypothetical protein
MHDDECDQGVAAGVRNPEDPAVLADCDGAAKTVAEVAARVAARRAANGRGARPQKRRRDQRGSNARRMVSNLQREPAVLCHLQARGLAEGTISALGLGVKEPYTCADGRTVSSVLTYPMKTGQGRTRFGCLAVPGVTQNPEHPVGWAPGAPVSVAIGMGDILVVCESAIEAWLAWQTACAVGTGITALASTHPDALPEEWRHQRFWAGWSRIVVSDGIALGILDMIVDIARRPLERCDTLPAPAADATLAPLALEDWFALAMDGQGMARAPATVPLAMTPGDFSASRVSIHGGYSAGRMYYGFTVERRERPLDGNAQMLYSYRTLVLRDDGAVLEPDLLPAPAGTPLDRRVHALSDGTRIQLASNVPVAGSWSLSAINDFVQARTGDQPYSGPSLSDLVGELTTYLRSVVWLPEDEDHALLSRFVVATYFHRVFEAFPLLHIHGPKTSGKSELTAAIAGCAFNGSLMAQGSAAALCRLARETGGLLAIDDAEGLTAGFGELAQVLKQGYKASTATKRLVSASGATQTIDFYGPRVICNTRGLDPIIASRCLTVETRPMPADHVRPSSPETEIGAWRDLMHAFAMYHVGAVAELAVAMKADITGRDGELLLPIRVIERLAAGDPMA